MINDLSQIQQASKKGSVAIVNLSTALCGHHSCSLFTVARKMIYELGYKNTMSDLKNKQAIHYLNFKLIILVIRHLVHIYIITVQVVWFV